MKLEELLVKQDEQEVEKTEEWDSERLMKRVTEELCKAFSELDEKTLWYTASVDDEYVEFPVDSIICRVYEDDEEDLAFQFKLPPRDMLTSTVWSCFVDFKDALQRQYRYALKEWQCYGEQEAKENRKAEIMALAPEQPAEFGLHCFGAQYGHAWVIDATEQRVSFHISDGEAVLYLSTYDLSLLQTLCHGGVWQSKDYSTSVYVRFWESGEGVGYTFMGSTRVVNREMLFGNDWYVNFHSHIEKLLAYYQQLEQWSEQFAVELDCTPEDLRAEYASFQRDFLRTACFLDD